jgi:transcriptional regulator of acetoin/glycerol metabolism
MIYRAWEDFQSGETRERLRARPIVIDSWERCRNSQVKLAACHAPSIEACAIGELRRRNRELLQAAAETLAESIDALAGTHSVMIITDASGVVLEAVGDMETVHAGMDIALTSGGDWRELCAGTNGIGTALETGRPVLVHASEHYCEGIKGWSCAGAPIVDPIDGSIAGILDISAKKDDASAQTLPLARLAARRIEQALIRQADRQHMRLLEMGLEHSQRHAGDAFVGIDGKGRVVFASRLAQRLLRERLNRAVPELARGVQLFDAPSGRTSSVLSDFPGDWLRPVLTDGEVSGHLLVIPAKSSSRPAGASKVAADEADPERSQFDCIVGVSEGIQTAIAQARRIAELDVPVLIEGETGVGKELFARAIHGESRVSRGPLIAFNCGAVSREMIASELFGYAKGAFTGASTEGRVGRFEQADGGTLSLDEIGELALDLQPYLLRVLEEGIVYRIGENIPRKVNVRIVAMTNRDLRAEVAAGRFRLDLYHRLSVTSVEVPPLCRREGDLEHLIEYFNPRLADRHKRPTVRFRPEAMALLRAYSWPGNVRELRNVVERSILFATDGLADVGCLPREIAELGSPEPTPAAPPPLAPALEPLLDEAGAIERAMQLSAGNLSVAAVMLGISRSTLYRKMSQHGLKRISPLAMRFNADRELN